jgi:hypothetical protein
MNPEQKDSIQSNLIKKYKLSRPEVERDILGIEKAA